MRAAFISGFFLLAMVVVAAVFHHKPPRRQAHLAALEARIHAALKSLPPNARLYFRADSAAMDYGVWSRYFAAPHRLLLTLPKSGDTVFWLRPASGSTLMHFDETPVALNTALYIHP